MLWSAYASIIDRFFVDKGRKILVDILSDTLTFVVLFLAVMTVIIAPILTGGTRSLDETRPYSITFTNNANEVIGHKGIRYNDTIDLERYSPYLIDAVLATEDRRFMQHFGIDLFGLLRAVIINIQAQTIVQGGSTITQQLAKNLFLTPEKSAKRKIQEAFLALWLEMNYSKQKILKLYLDRSYFGNGNFGVEAASQNYFNKSVQNINLAEAALIAGLLKAPSKYSPTNDINAARERTKTVLNIMSTHRFALADEIYNATKYPAKIVTNNNYNADYFFDWLYEKAIRLSQNQSKILTVKTTLDSRLQAAATAIFNSAFKEHEDEYEVSQGALIAMSPNGAIKAMLGGRNYNHSQFNRATNSLRQPGSVFKPILYVAALENGYTQSTIVKDAPIRFGKWKPQNYNNRYFGNVSLTKALQKSLNSVPIRISEKIGTQTIIKNAQKLGIKQKLKANRSLALGTSEISLLEMTTAYSTIANKGFQTEAFGIEEIYDAHNKIIYSRKSIDRPSNPLFKKTTIDDIKIMLKSVVDKGTGRTAKIDNTDSYGKTGTTQDYRDAWFIGFTDDLVAGVWLGNDNFKTTNELTGGKLPAKIWKQFFETALSLPPREQVINKKPNLNKTEEIMNSYPPLSTNNKLSRHKKRVFDNLHDLFYNQ